MRNTKSWSIAIVPQTVLTVNWRHTSDGGQQREVPAGRDGQRVARLKQRAERLVEHLAAEHYRTRKFRRAQLWVNVLLAAAVIALGAGTAMEYVFLKDLARDVSAVQKRVDSSDAALNRIVGIIEHNEKTSKEREAVFTRAIAAIRTSFLLPAVDAYLSHLEATGKWEFNDPVEKAKFSWKLKSRIRPAIVSEIEAQPGITDAQVRQRIEQLVVANLGTGRSK